MGSLMKDSNSEKFERGKPQEIDFYETPWGKPQDHLVRRIDEFVRVCSMEEDNKKRIGNYEFTLSPSIL